MNIDGVYIDDDGVLIILSGNMYYYQATYPEIDMMNFIISSVVHDNMLVKSVYIK